MAFQDVPPDWAVREVEDELRAGGGSLHPDMRPGAAGSGGGCGAVILDGHREHAAEFYDGEGDHDKGREEL